MSENRFRALVSDWQANGNSRELGDPAAVAWHKAARQLLDALNAAEKDQPRAMGGRIKD